MIHRLWVQIPAESKRWVCSPSNFVEFQLIWYMGHTDTFVFLIAHWFIYSAMTHLFIWGTLTCLFKSTFLFSAGHTDLLWPCVVTYSIDVLGTLVLPVKCMMTPEQSKKHMIKTGEMICHTGRMWLISLNVQWIELCYVSFVATLSWSFVDAFWSWIGS